MENKYVDLDNFLKLCRKAQEMIFDALYDCKTNMFFELFGIDDAVPTMTPIEQLFQIGALILQVKNKNISFHMTAQEKIKVKDKNYMADFCISEYTVWDFETGKSYHFRLTKPLIIELDGKDYHSSKEQMNYDYQRENDLKLAGYEVMRFTGSQIYNDVYECLNKTYLYVAKLNREKL